MSEMIWQPYRLLLGNEVVEQLFQIAHLLKGKKIVHVNSTREGGGVAEILNKMVPLMASLGLDTRWEIIEGNADFFQCTKMFHNLFQGNPSAMPTYELLQNYEETNRKNAERLSQVLESADFVVIHDPQPLALINHFPNRKGKWIWRCHIDTSTAPRAIWRYARPSLEKFDASIYSAENYYHPLPHPLYVIPPSIDPFSEKNIELDAEEISQVYKRFNIDTKRPVILQVSRFDNFKDPLGVIEAYKLAKKFNPGLQLVLAGGSASDDPEGEAVLKNVEAAAKRDPDIFVLNLSPDSHRIINALQRGADIILQKSIKEGFGLTVTEALWKMKPVIGGDTGGIRIQIFNRFTGFLVSTPEGAANRIRYLLQLPEIGAEMGKTGKKLVKENFLITRHIREYLTVMATLQNTQQERIDLSKKTEMPKP